MIDLGEIERLVSLKIEGAHGEFIPIRPDERDYLVAAARQHQKMLSMILGMADGYRAEGYVEKADTIIRWLMEAGIVKEKSPSSTRRFVTPQPAAAAASPPRASRPAPRDPE